MGSSPKQMEHAIVKNLPEKTGKSLAAILLKSRSCDAIFAAHNKTFLLVRVLQGKAKLD